MRGFEITDETLALDVIENVGPGGDFLSERHTLKHFRKELWRPMYMNKDPPEAWKKKGAKTYGELVIDKAKDILKTHKPIQLNQEQQTAIDLLYEKGKEVLKDISFPA